MYNVNELLMLQIKTMSVTRLAQLAEADPSVEREDCRHVVKSGCQTTRGSSNKYSFHVRTAPTVILKSVDNDSTTTSCTGYSRSHTEQRQFNPQFNVKNNVENYLTSNSTLTFTSRSSHHKFRICPFHTAFEIAKTEVNSTSNS